VFPYLLHKSSSMLWKSPWIGDWFLRRAAGLLDRTRIQGNQILISAYDEILNRGVLSQLLNDW
jgi:hypothetical protein